MPPANLNNASMKTRKFMLIAILLLLPVAYAQQPDSPRPERIRVSSGVAEGQIIRRIDPVYPKEAQENHIQGEVVLTATISKEGNIINLKVVSGHPLLADAAVEAVKQWKYRPYILNDEPVEIETTVTVRYIHHQPTPTRIRISRGVSAGPKTHDVTPEYPLAAKANHLQGDVVLSAVISKEGNLIDIKVVSGHPVLAAAALDAVKQWKYKPYVLQGEPVEVETSILIKFHM